MCCGRRNNQNAYNLAQMLLSRSVESRQVKQLEPLGPPPAYEKIEQNTIASLKKQDAFTTRAVSEYTTIGPDQGSTSNSMTVAAKRERKSEMRQLKREHRQERREYRQEKRELRMERRDEKKEMRGSRRGTVDLLVQGVSNLMKR
jgi:hypothetical protein